MIETLLTVLVISLLFFGLFQLSQVFASKEILQHAAARAARARTVGLNSWMCKKAMRVAAIPNAGAMVSPQATFEDAYLQDLVANHTPGEVWDKSLSSFPSSQKVGLERALIPEYMGSANLNSGRFILDYEDWDTIHASGTDGLGVGDTLTVRVNQEYPLFVSLSHWLYPPVDDADATHVQITGECTIENHYSLYLDDRNW